MLFSGMLQFIKPARENEVMYLTVRFLAPCWKAIFPEPSRFPVSCAQIKLESIQRPSTTIFDLLLTRAQNSSAGLYSHGVMNLVCSRTSTFHDSWLNEHMFKIRK